VWIAPIVQVASIARLGLVQMGRAVRLAPGARRVRPAWVAPPSRSAATLALALVAGIASAQSAPPPAIGFDQRLGATVPLDAPFVDTRGDATTLRRLLDGRPAIIVPGYYQCPNLCDTVRTSLAASLTRIDLAAGSDYTVVAVGIDPAETSIDAEDAARALGTASVPRGWHFLTGAPRATHALAQAIGFRYAADAANGGFAHPAGAVVVTPAGVVSRYFLGVEFPAAELRASLVAAGANEVGAPVRALLLRCFHFDPVTGRYTGDVVAASRALGVMLVAGLVLLVGRLLRRPGAARGGAS
jgi:protein SCO1/2